MKRPSSLRLLVVTCMFIWLLPAATAQSGPEERALVEIVTAKDFPTVERHLPEVVRSQLANLSPAQRQEFEEVVCVAARLRKLGVQVHVPEDGHALLSAQKLTDEPTEPPVDLVLRKKMSNGDEAVLELGLNREAAELEREGTFQVWMKLEQGEWRVTGLRTPGGDSIELNEKFLDRFKVSKLPANEASAVSAMRVFNTAQVTYASTYPDIGFSETLAALDGAGDSPQGAGLIDSVLASGVKSGYRFTMVVVGGSPHTTYTIVARPLQYDVTGRRSFFTDESGVIRFTEENREATRKDSPLQ